MNLLHPLQERFGFTRKELTAVLALSTTFLVGATIKLCAPAATPVRAHESFSYAQLDSQFIALSRTSADTTHAAPRSASRKSADALPPRSIDPNRATTSELQRLPGIGPAIAERIIAYRSSHGPFRTLEGICEVKGIGPRILERIRPYLVLTQ
jgi:competence ComEA-like helix-hairpin-helix protein